MHFENGWCYDMEIGKKLKETREENNISLETLQETTKIQKRYLLAIEQGNFHLLPGKFYARAFIKEYALAVGLDADELLANHQDELPSTEEKEAVAYSRMQRTNESGSSSKSPAFFSIIPSIIVFLLIIGIVIVAYTLNQKSADKDNSNPVDQRETDQIIRNNDGKDNNNKVNIGDNNNNENENNENENNENENDEKSNENKNNETNENNENENEDEEEEVENSFEVITTGTGPKPESTIAFAGSKEELIVTLEPTGESWLDVKNGSDESLYSGFTAANEPLEFTVTDQDRIWLNIGSAPNVPVIKVNGTELEYPIDPNSSVTQRLWINFN